MKNKNNDNDISNVEVIKKKKKLSLKGKRKNKRKRNIPEKKRKVIDLYYNGQQDYFFIFDHNKIWKYLSIITYIKKKRNKYKSLFIQKCLISKKLNKNYTISYIILF